MYCTARILKFGKRRIYGVAECHGKKGGLFTHHTLTYVRPHEPAHTEIRDAVRRFAREQLAPNAARWDREQRVPARGAEGPRRAGPLRRRRARGVGRRRPRLHRARAIACEEIAAGDGATSTIVAVNNLVAGILNGYGNDAQKEKFLKPLARGEMLGAFASPSRTSARTPRRSPRAPSARATSYVLNGVKQFITSGKNADIAIVFAVTDKAAGKNGISAFVVPTDDAGLHRGAHRGQDRPARLRHRADRVRELPRAGRQPARRRKATAIASRSPTSSPAASASPRRRSAWRAPRSRRRSPTPRERKSLGKPLIEHQAINFRLADMATQIEAARQLYLHAARLRDAGQPCLKEASMAKLFASEMAERVCSDAIQIHGGYGYVADFPVERI